jgi:hypothetical protein
MIVGVSRSAAVLLAALVTSAPCAAAEFACTADQCVERINEIVRKTHEELVAAKQTCEAQGASERCIYRASSGPNIHVFFTSGLPNVQTILIADTRGLSPAGNVYMDAIMEAFDASLDAAARKDFHAKLIDASAPSLQNGGQAQLSSAGFAYSLFTNEKLTMIIVSGAPVPSRIFLGH